MVVAYASSEFSPAAVFVPKHWAERRRAVIALAIMMPFAATAAFSRPWIGSGSFATVACEVFGWNLFLAGAILRLWATIHIGGRKGRVMVTDGPYSMTRNPLYFAIFLMTLSVAIFLQSAALALGLFLAVSSYLLVTVQSEERRLSARWGEDYLDYCRRVPRFWPQVGTLRMPTVLAVDVRCLAVECRRALRWGWIPLAAEAVMRLRHEAWWPVLSWLS